MVGVRGEAITVTTQVSVDLLSNGGNVLISFARASFRVYQGALLLLLMLLRGLLLL